MSRWKLVSRGKVREVYENVNGTRVLLVASDAVPGLGAKSTAEIPHRGKMLTKVSKDWFRQTNAIAPNAYIPASADPDPNVIPTFGEAAIEMLRLDMLPIRVVVRGYLAGSMWEAYDSPAKVREFCGLKLPNGLKNSTKLGSPIFTPTTKHLKEAREVELSFEEMVEHMEKQGIQSAFDRALVVREHALKLYEFAYAKMLKKGIILADTKFEFGVDPVSGNIMLADELFTPDSSRFWAANRYEPGHEQKALGVQIVKDWVKKHPGRKVPEDVLEEAEDTFIRLCEIITSNHNWN